MFERAKVFGEFLVCLIFFLFLFFFFLGGGVWPGLSGLKILEFGRF